ncbi:MAG: cytoplasmic protein [Chloroflexota bacterium]|nr:cytoplasmic protein [Chloroflexota bacterium]
MAVSNDPVQVAPHVYKVSFENDRVRVLDVHMQPGEKSAMHAHPAYVCYLLAPAKVKFTAGDGTTAEVEFPAGVVWRDAEEHAVEYVGLGEMRAVFVELK